jgi:LmbE family N-acetylglucosaminyl deacetylase
MNVLVIIAHPDDEAYGPYGTITRLVQDGHTVQIACLCNGERPGAESVAAGRVAVFKSNCERLGAQWRIWNSPDLSLELNNTISLLTQIVTKFRPAVVYTHNISDINHDHQIVAEATMVACRPKPECSVNELYFYEVPSSTDWAFSQLQPAFQPTTYVDISNVIENKQAALSEYVTEIYKFPDARSVEAMTTLAKYRGFQVGFEYAEAFRLVFARRRKTQ